MNKKYWLIGLLIGVIVALISSVLFAVAYLTGDTLQGEGEWISWLLLVPSMIPMIIVSFVIGWGHSIIGSFFVYSFLGLIFGWLYGKTKK